MKLLQVVDVVLDSLHRARLLLVPQQTHNECGVHDTPVVFLTSIHKQWSLLSGTVYRFDLFMVKIADKANGL